MDSINLLIDFLIKSKPEEIRKILNDCREPEDILQKYKKDSVSENALIQLLQCSVKNKDIQWFLIDIFFFIDDKSITEDVLDIFLHYPGKFKKTLLIQLAHLPLQEKFLIALNKRIDSTEAFYQLVLLYLFDNTKTCTELEKFLVKNKSKLHCLLNYKCLLKSRKIEKCKVNTIDLILNKYKKEIDKNIIKI